MHRIYEGAGALYIQLDECVDCEARELVCAVEAICYEENASHIAGSCSEASTCNRPASEMSCPRGGPSTSRTTPATSSLLARQLRRTAWVRAAGWADQDLFAISAGGQTPSWP